MRGSTNQKVVILIAVLATAGSLNQCAKDLGRELVPDRSFEAYLQEGFGPVSQKVVGANSNGGQRIEIHVTSTQIKSWTDAEMLMSRKAGCGEGRTYTPEWARPAIAMDKPDEVVAAMNQERPAGTTFVLRLSCEGPLPGEVSFDATTGADEAMALVAERIGGTDPYDADGVTNMAAQLVLSKDHRKYTAFNEYLGSSAKFAYRACRGPAILENIVTTALPPPTNDESKWATGYLIVGVDFACAMRSDATPHRPTP